MIGLLFKIENFVHYNLIKCPRATNVDETSKCNDNLPIGRINIAQSKYYPVKWKGNEILYSYVCGL